MRTSDDITVDALLGFTSLLLMGEWGDWSILRDRETKRWWVRWTAHQPLPNGQVQLVAMGEHLAWVVRDVTVQYAEARGLSR